MRSLSNNSFGHVKSSMERPAISRFLLWLYAVEVSGAVCFPGAIILRCRRTCHWQPAKPARSPEASGSRSGPRDRGSFTAGRLGFRRSPPETAAPPTALRGLRRQVDCPPPRNPRFSLDAHTPSSRLSCALLPSDSNMRSCRPSMLFEHTYTRAILFARAGVVYQRRAGSTPRRVGLRRTRSFPKTTKRLKYCSLVSGEFTFAEASRKEIVDFHRRDRVACPSESNYPVNPGELFRRRPDGTPS
jgi:hypothetical protein